MDGEPNEIELKFEIEPDAMARLRADPSLSTRLEPPRELLSTYFDTDDRALRDADLTLRLRREGDGWTQTVKSASAGGLFARGEWERPVAGAGGPDLAAAMDTPLKDLLGDAGFGARLRPVFATRVRRQAALVTHGGSDVEVCLDEGEIEGDGRRTTLSEVELELKTGAPAALFALADKLFGDAPPKLSFVSKAERGYALVDGAARPEKTPAGPPLRRKATAGDAFQAICRLCLVQLSANERVLMAARAPEAIHQMRIALRRLRSAMSTFRHVTADDRHGAVKAELEWLAGAFDEARDLDVFARDAFAPAVAASPADPGMAALGERILEAKREAYDRAVRAIDSDRFRRLLLDAARWIEAGQWATSDEPPFKDAREIRVARHARSALDKRLKAVAKRGDALEGNDPRVRHELRIRVKKLRYAAEFFTALYPKKAQRRFIDALRELQDDLGELNDIVVGRELAVDLTRDAPAAAFAAGQVTGLQAAREAALTKAGRKAFRRLMKREPYWRQAGA